MSEDKTFKFNGLSELILTAYFGRRSIFVNRFIVPNKRADGEEMIL